MSSDVLQHWDVCPGWHRVWDHGQATAGPSTEKFQCSCAPSTVSAIHSTAETCRLVMSASQSPSDFQQSVFTIVCFHSLAPSVTVRPQGSSPYKKADILASGATVTAKGRSVAAGPSTAPTVAAPASSEDASRMQVRYRRLHT